jgi:hypothetical protein
MRRRPLRVPAVFEPWSSLLDRHPRWKGPILVAGVTAVVVVLAVVLAYAPNPVLAFAPTHGPPFVFSNVTRVTATGGVNGPGGCAAPGGTAVEYCYRLLLAWAVSVTGPLNLSEPGPVQYANTSVVTFTVERVGTSIGISYVNVTVLGPSGRLLASYAEPSGWAAAPSEHLPLVILANDSVVLNFGPQPATSYELVATEGAWGSTESYLP